VYSSQCHRLWVWNLVLFPPTWLSSTHHHDYYHHHDLLFLKIRLTCCEGEEISLTTMNGKRSLKRVSYFSAIEKFRLFIRRVEKLMKLSCFRNTFSLAFNLNWIKGALLFICNRFVLLTGWYSCSAVCIGSWWRVVWKRCLLIKDDPYDAWWIHSPRHF
jgi:hypothetical protein